MADQNDMITFENVDGSDQDEFQMPLPPLLGKKKSSKKIQKRQCRGLGCNAETCPSNGLHLSKKKSKTVSWIIREAKKINKPCSFFEESKKPEVDKE